MKMLLHACSAHIGQVVDRLPWADRGAYADWLAQTYYYVRHSTRLLAAAAARCPQDERGAALHARLSTHMAEETRHELLCVRDLQALGVAAEDLPEQHATRMLYEPQYYKIDYLSPMALFGYILPLEMIGPLHGTRIVDQLVRDHGDQCVSFLRLHVSADIEHLDRALAMLEGLTTSEHQLIQENMKQTTHAYAALLDAVSARASAETHPRFPASSI